MLMISVSKIVKGFLNAGIYGMREIFLMVFFMVHSFSGYQDNVPGLRLYLFLISAGTRAAAK